MKNKILFFNLLLIFNFCSAYAEQHQGHLSIWPESEVFIPCGSKEPLWLDYTSSTRDVLAKKHWELQSEPYGTTFAVIEGQIGPQLDCGFCEDFKGSFKVVNLIEHRSSSPSDCK